MRMISAGAFLKQVWAELLGEKVGNGGAFLKQVWAELLGEKVGNGSDEACLHFQVRSLWLHRAAPLVQAVKPLIEISNFEWDL
ncbi:hypothetical protein MJO28_014097 [Puccinia striiformis f. sp. tritici]|uniref:Uncharacterized protein n=1 Tax=Puccinia striiformis f. sp. tritici TaxID=168172 RepID=A0ACC0DXF7_9BASI|nr:hypothetical protein MJO28_014097 [Puccinia striiformis f. sp. tritici]